MEFLKSIFNDKALTYDELVQAINAHNGNEANKENLIKIGNLGMGDYVAKGKYDNLQALLDGSKNDVMTLTETIESLKKGKVDSETLQQKVADVEKLLEESKARENELKVKYALDVAMLAEGVRKENAELLTIALERRLKEKGEALEVDEVGNIKGWEDKLSGLKTQFPSMFESSGADGYQVLGDNRLPGSDNEGSTVTKEDFAKMGYKSRVELKANNPELYSNLTK